MALVTVFLIGLTQFSDLGTGPSIMQSRRGDDPDFLDTAWTIQIVRGACLWLAGCALAAPAAHFYGEPMLASLLPVMALSLLVAGFNPTRLETANRHLMLGRVTLLELCVQVLGLAATVALAWRTQSVWALALGGLVPCVAKLALTRLLLPGPANRLRWDPAAARELIHFGAWIFLSSICGFLVSQGDKAVLGKYLPLESFGIYNIGYFLASFPLMLGAALTGRILIPLYRERPPAASPENYAKIRRMRSALTAAILSLLAAMAFGGIPLVGLLYDPRFAAAGTVVVAVACILVPQAITLTYDQAALAAGDSRRFFYLVAAKAAAQVAFLLVGVEAAGLAGGLAGQGLAALLVYPVIVWLARRHGAWDPLHDAAFGGLGAGLIGLALWLNWEAVAGLSAMG